MYYIVSCNKIEWFAIKKLFVCFFFDNQWFPKPDICPHINILYVTKFISIIIMSVKLSLRYFYSGFRSCCLFGLFFLTLFSHWFHLQHICSVDERKSFWALFFAHCKDRKDRIRNGIYCWIINSSQSPMVISYTVTTSTAVTMTFSLQRNDIIDEKKPYRKFNIKIFNGRAL